MISKKTKKLKRTDPPKVGIRFHEHFRTFQNSKTKLKKDPWDTKENKSLMNKKVEKLKKTDHPKNGNSDSETSV